MTYQKNHSFKACNTYCFTGEKREVKKTR